MLGRTVPKRDRIRPLCPGAGPRSGVCIHVSPQLRMLKLIGSYAIAKLLGFGLVGAIVIYGLLSLLT